MGRKFFLFKRSFYTDFFNNLREPKLKDADFLASIKPTSEISGKLLGMKNTILNLVYPAILGAIIYSIIAYTPDPILQFWKIWNYISASCENGVSILALLGIILFFLCDYLHLYVVRSYSFPHFAIHLLTSLLLLKAALYFLPENAGGDPAPMIEKYRRTFWIFFSISVFYLAHDSWLLKKRKEPKISTIEKPLYYAYAWVNGFFLILLLVIQLFLPALPVTKLLLTMLLIIAATVVYFYLLAKKNEIEKAKADHRKEKTILDSLKKDPEALKQIIAGLTGISTVSGAIAELKQNVEGIAEKITSSNTAIGVLNGSIRDVNEKIKEINP